MKSSIFNLAVALVVITNVSDGSFHTRKVSKVSQDELLEASQNDIPTKLLTDIYSLEQEKFPMKGVSNELKLKTTVFSNLTKSSIDGNLNDFVMVGGMSLMSIEEVIAEDNAITENQFSNEAQVANLVTIDDVLAFNNEKSIEEVIAEDSAITENQFSNETETLNFVSIENVLPYENQKSIEEVIAEDNAITENQLADEEQEVNVVTIDNLLFFNNEKSIDEVISEDNAITENQTLNETKALDFHSSYMVKIDNVVFDRSDKTIEEIIAEDNAIVGN